METASIIRKPRRAVRPLAGRKGSTAKPAKKCTAGAHGNGFLNHSFNPVWGVAFKDWRSAEREFFVSLENLCDLYGWTKPDYSGLSFPQNISAAYKDVSGILGSNSDIKLNICQDKTHHLCLATSKTFDTNYHLYYIPVRPLWKMRDIKAEQLPYDLLMAVFRYLYQVSGVPFFTEPGTIDGNYDTIKNWLDEEQEEEEEPYRERQKNELKALELAGNTLLPELKKPFFLKELERDLAKYQRTANCDTYLVEVVYEFVKLVGDYPKRAIKETMYYGDEDDDNQTIYWEQYISFYWSGEDCLSETLYQMVNDEFQEMGYQEEPVNNQWFDTPQEKPCHVFDYEPRLLSLIDRLAEILNDYDYEEPNE
ncbi:MAG TPA: hypothetical protein VGN20_26400 [Mucilaginibacter sp.]|jgi:hypothetical protein